MLLGGFLCFEDKYYTSQTHYRLALWLQELGRYIASILLLQLHEPVLVRSHFTFFLASFGFTCVDIVAIILEDGVSGLLS